MQRCQAMITRLVRRSQDAESGVAMLLALFLIASLMTISITVAGITLSQVKPTQLDRKAVATENGAESGFDVALNRIRAAATGTTTNNLGVVVPAGSRAKLPCGPINGTISNGASTDTSYSVVLRYYASDPTVFGTGASNPQVLCQSGVVPSPLPGFVVMQASGSAATIPGTRVGSGNRTLETVYALNTTNQNIPGGNIPFVANSQTQCIADYPATVGTIAQGDKVYVTTCDPSAAGQKWSYTANLQLQIVASDHSLQCIQSSDSTGAAATAQYSVVLLEPCSTNTLPPGSPYTPAAQVWSYNDGGFFQISNSTDTGLGSYCLNTYTGTPGGGVAALVNGDFIDIDSCSGTGQFIPVASVGAGAAGTSLRPFQLVNYANFGRCIDDTNQNQNATWLIGYPCKQDPLATNLTWNQKYYTGVSDGLAGSGANAGYGGSGTDTVISTPTVWDSQWNVVTAGTGCQISATVACQFVAFPNGANSITPAYFCLEAGNTANPSAPIDGTIVSVQPCVTNDVYQKWTYSKPTSAATAAASYASQYLIQPYGASSSNLCLSMTIGSTPPALTYGANAGGAPIAAYGYISLQTCNGGGWQKWNAPPNPQSSVLKNTFEEPINASS
jgi:hypothetical protein